MNDRLKLWASLALALFDTNMRSSNAPARYRKPQKTERQHREAIEAAEARRQKRADKLRKQQ